MLQIFQRCFSFFRPPRSAEAQTPTTVLLVRVPLRSHHGLREPLLEVSPTLDASADAVARDVRGTLGGGQQTQSSSITSDEKTLRQLGIFPPRVARKLSRLGVRTVSGFVSADPSVLADRMGGRQYAAKIRRRQRAIRFSRRFSQMTPLEALLLFATHRRSRAALAADSPAVLHRDLQRLLLSSAGQRLAGDRPAPDIAHVRHWICEAKTPKVNRLPQAYADQVPV